MTFLLPPGTKRLNRCEMKVHFVVLLHLLNVQLRVKLGTVRMSEILILSKFSKFLSKIKSIFNKRSIMDGLWFNRIILHWDNIKLFALDTCAICLLSIVSFSFFTVQGVFRTLSNIYGGFKSTVATISMHL